MIRRLALPFFHPVTIVATFFGVGALPLAPGTWGSLAALPLAALLVWLGGPWLLLAATALVCWLGAHVSEVYRQKSSHEDPSEVVIDEVAGQWLAVLPLCLDQRGYAIAFLAFRLFDIVKVWPASWVDRNNKSGWGIMADDLVAGVYAAVLAAVIAHYWLGIVCFPPL